MHLGYALTINGLAPDGVSGLTGVLLDGAGTGQPGSNFQAIFGREILAGPAGDQPGLRNSVGRRPQGLGRRPRCRLASPLPRGGPGRGHARA